MHLISHFSSGFCIGSFLFAIRSNGVKASPFLLPMLIGIGATLPDLDGVTIIFNRSVYYGNFWYSHRGILHSLFGIMPIAIVIAFFLTSFSRLSNKTHLLCRGFLVFVLLYAGCVIHILEDLPCPSVPWGGLRVFWPLSDQRIGGWSHIWWLNEYVMTILTIGMLLSLLVKVLMTKKMFYSSKVPRLLLVLNNGVILFLTTRFVIVSRYQDHTQWQLYQKGLLGSKVYAFVSSINSIYNNIW